MFMDGGNMNRLLMICVSKGRPDRIQTMIDKL